MSQAPGLTDAVELDPQTTARIAAARRAHALLAAGSSITAVELSAITGLNEHTIHKQAREGRYPSQQPTGPGGARRFSPEDVAAIRAAIARPATAVVPA